MKHNEIKKEDTQSIHKQEYHTHEQIYAHIPICV